MYLQARHFVQSNTTLVGTITSTDVFSETMAWIKARPFRIKFLYSSLLEPLVDKAWTNPLWRWSCDLANLVSSDVWVVPCGRALRCLPSAALQETHLRTIQRAYISLGLRGNIWSLMKQGDVKNVEL